MNRCLMAWSAVMLAVAAVHAEPMITIVAKDDGTGPTSLIELAPLDQTRSQAGVYLQGSNLNELGDVFVYDPVSFARRADISVMIQPASTATINSRLCSFRVSDQSPAATGLVVRFFNGTQEQTIPGFTITVSAPSTNTAEATAAAVAAAAAAAAAAAELEAAAARPTITHVTTSGGALMSSAALTPITSPYVEVILQGTNLHNLTSAFLYDTATGQQQGDVFVTLGVVSGSNTSRVVTFNAQNNSARAAYGVRLVAGNCSACGAAQIMELPNFSLIVNAGPFQPVRVTIPRISGFGTRGQ
ncbi:MAG: hypothetical protein AAB229_02240, partial [Candidatus Hydrogenedentota bacterium]